MGCLHSHPNSQHTREEAEEEQSESRPKYSWEKRKNVDPKDYTLENLKGETAGRIPGTVSGQQFLIRNCEDSNIYIFDNSATITVDDCVNCRLFLGPIRGSIFIRDCRECKLVVACQQFRTRDCSRLDVFLSCATQPIIEATTGIKVGCFQYHYPELDGQFKSAEVSIFNNNWSNIHDFTPVPGEKNFSLMPEDAKVEDFVPLPATEQFAQMQICTDPEKSTVPKTLGSRRKPAEESSLVVFFNDGGSHERALQFILKMKEKYPQCVLVQSKELTMQTSDAQRVFGSDGYAMAVQQGPVIGFEYNGDGCIQACQDIGIAVSKGTTGLMFVSMNRNTAAQQIENFYNFADMQMGV